tara:strand:+ start:66 stop:521 length:456 start_codon:yes stop_codon:yes gene_type:complete
MKKNRKCIRDIIKEALINEFNIENISSNIPPAGTIEKNRGGGGDGYYYIYPQNPEGGNDGEVIIPQNLIKRLFDAYHYLKYQIHKTKEEYLDSDQQQIIFEKSFIVMEIMEKIGQFVLEDYLIFHSTDGMKGKKATKAFYTMYRVLDDLME